MPFPALDATVIMMLLAIALGGMVFTAGGMWLVLGLARASRGGPTWPVTFFAAIFLLNSIPCFVITAIVGWDSWWYATHATQVQGRVVGSHFRGGIIPLVEYEYEGRKYRTEVVVRWGKKRQSLGPTVLIRVDHPSAPESARVDSFGSLWGVPLIFLAGGVVCSVGFFCMWAYRGRLIRRRGTAQPAVAEH